MRILLPLLFVITAIVLLSVGRNQHSQRQSLIDDGARVQGTVVTVRSSTDSDGDATYAPVYEYRAGGQTHRHEPGVKTSSRPQVGATETLYVDKDDPNHVIADTFADRWFVPMMFAIFGVVSFIVAIVLTATLRRSGRRSQELGPHTTSHDSHAPVTMSTASSTSASTTSGSVQSSGPFVDDNRGSDSRGPFV